MQCTERRERGMGGQEETVMGLLRQINAKLDRLADGTPDLDAAALASLRVGIEHMRLCGVEFSYQDYVDSVGALLAELANRGFVVCRSVTPVHAGHEQTIASNIRSIPLARLAEQLTQGGI